MNGNGLSDQLNREFPDLISVPRPSRGDVNNNNPLDVGKVLLSGSKFDTVNLRP